jgi:hypothetical protein
MKALTWFQTGLFAIGMFASGRSAFAAIGVPDNETCPAGSTGSNCLSISTNKNNSNAILGTNNTTGGNGVVGQGANRGISGTAATATTGTGVYGFSELGTGMVAGSSSGVGLSATSTSNIAISATSSSNEAISARSDYTAIEAASTGNAGSGMTAVYGHHDSDTVFGYGVGGRVRNSASIAVYGDNLAGGWAGQFHGDVQVTGTLFAGVYGASDARLKKDIRDLPYGLAQLSKLHPITFRWIKEPKDSGPQLGLIAQDVQKVTPEVVRTDPSTGMLAVNYSALVPLLIKATQDQQRVIDQQEARLAHLEGSLAPKRASLFPEGNVGALLCAMLPIGLWLDRRRRQARGT